VEAEFDDIDVALRSAVDLARRERARVGLDLGDAAAALSRAAEPGQVLASKVVVALAGDAHRFASIGRPVYAGADPVEAWMLAWRGGAEPGEPPPAPPVPRPAGLPATLAAERPQRFVGRARELRHLDRVWSTAATGRRLVVVSGEPGAGKTALAATFAATVAARGVPVLHGRAADGLALPFQPFVEAVRQYGGDPAGRNPELGRLAPDLVPDTVPPPADVDPATGRYRLFEAVSAFVDDVARAGPALLVLDDLQWADTASLLLVRHLLRTGIRPVLVVATVRATDLEGAARVRNALAELWVDARVERLALGGLRPEEIAELADGDVALGDELHARTAGNAFYVRELLRERGRHDVPATVVEVVTRRAGELGATAEKVLTHAALMSQPFAVDLVAALSDLSSDDVLDAVDASIGAGLLHDAAGAPGRLAFTHAIVRDALGALLSDARRRRLQLRLGELIEKRYAANLDPHLADLVALFVACGAPEVEGRAVSYARQAAAAAMDQYAFEEAAAYLEQVQPLVRDLATRCEVELELGAAHRGANQLAGARAHFRAAAPMARALGDGAALVRAALGATIDGVTVGVVHDDDIALLQEAIAAAPADDPAGQVHLRAQLTRELLFGASSAAPVAVAEEAVDIARASGDAALVSHALGALHQALIGPAEPGARLAIAEEIVALAGASGDLDAQRWGHAYRLVDLLELGDLTGAESEIDACEAIAAAMRPPRFVWWAEALRAMHATAVGRFADAEAALERAFRLGLAVDHPNAAATYATQVFFVRWHQGRLAELRGFADAAAAEPGATPAVWQAAMALVDVEAGEVDRAAARVRAMAPGLAGLPADLLRRSTLAMAALASRWVGDADVGAAAAELLRPDCGRAIVVATGTALLGAADTFVGCGLAAGGPTAAAVAHLEAGVRFNQTMGAAALVDRATEELVAATGRD
jgi:hypothetical protein